MTLRHRHLPAPLLAALLLCGNKTASSFDVAIEVVAVQAVLAMRWRPKWRRWSKQDAAFLRLPPTTVVWVTCCWWGRRKSLLSELSALVEGAPFLLTAARLVGCNKGGKQGAETLELPMCMRG